MAAFRLLLLSIACAHLTLFSLAFADVASVEQLFRSGQYQAAETEAAEQVEAGVWNVRWPILLMQCRLVQGKYAEALDVYESAVTRYPTNLPLRMLGLEALRYTDNLDRVESEKTRIFQLMQGSLLRFGSRDNLIAAGRYFADQGEDARQILELFFDRVRNADPDYLDSYIATAELALEKGDFKVAAETMAAAERIDASEPIIAYLTARAFESSDPKRANEAIERALQLNPNHVPSLLFLAEAAIDRELYETAQETVSRVIKINPQQSDAWALRAVMAHLKGDYELEKQMRAKALSHWSENPRVDFLIGQKLSQKYRFAEGADYQRKSLELDPDNRHAQFQLAQDLLRLGEEQPGWQLARKVSDDDPYNVVAHNLMTLLDEIKDYRILEAEGIRVRMETREAEIYGDAVIELLIEARDVLCEKYDVQPNAPILVEIFPKQKDFAIRTFGLPGGAGYLGVCFGRVITANSPASQGERPANWKSVLWHEFCHVVTLEKTRNRMPRWLSEGISVYEERCKDSSWGESITPSYREMMLSDALTPVSKLSAAFLTPASPMHLQFAYYESSLVVQFIIEKHGIDALKQILVDLGDGLPIQDALGRSVGSTDKLDAEFADYAKQIAESFGPDADWTRLPVPERPTIEQLTSLLEDHPNNYWVLRSLAEMQVAQKQDEQALPMLESLQQFKAVTGSRGGPLETLATLYQRQEQLDKERETLQQIVSLSSDALGPLRRLIEIAKQEEQWEQVAQYCEQLLAIQPLLPDGHQALASAAKELDQPMRAVKPLTALLSMEPIDPAGSYFQLANVLSQAGQKDQAKHHVLRALEEAPRYRDAHTLLLELVDGPQVDDEPEADAISSAEAKLKPDPESESRSEAETEPDVEVEGDSKPADESNELENEKTPETDQ